MLGAQPPPLLIDHCSTFVPRFNVTAVVASAAFAIVPLPCAKVHDPVSVESTVFADTEVTEDVTHSVWLGVLIVAVVGKGETSRYTKF